MPAISFQSVSKAYPSPRGSQSSTFLALDKVSLDIEPGEFFGLLGPNGAGKTTLITILAGLAKASSGRVSVLGSDVQADYAAARRKLGVVPQELVFDPFFNVREALRFQSGYFGVKHNDAWIDELLESLGLSLKQGRIVADDDGRTGVPGLYAGGDCRLGGRDLTVEAVQDGKRAALAIHAQLAAASL